MTTQTSSQSACPKRPASRSWSTTRVGRALRALLVYVVILSFAAFVSGRSIADDKMRTLPVPTVSASIALPTPALAPLKKGQIAPWDGVLLNGAAVAQITVDKENAQKECDIATSAAVAKQKAFDDEKLSDKDSEIKYDKDTLNKQLQDKDAEITQLRKANAPSNNGIWWGVGGVLGGVLFTVSVVFLVSLARK